MVYERPTLRLQGKFNDVLRRLMPVSLPGENTNDWRVDRLLQFLAQHFDRLDWNLPQVCRQLKLDISAPHAARLFKRHTGMGIREYAKKRRLSRAAERLTATNLPIKVISAESGYRKPIDFARGFKAQYQLSPSEFRRRSA